MGKFQIGIIGLGAVAQVHLLAYQQIEDFNIVAGVDISKERAIEMSKKWGFKAYTDYHDMIETETINIIIVCVPCRYHSKVVLDIAKYQIPILVEKPLASSVAEAQAMINQCNDYETKLGYGASYRWLPACIKAKKLLENNKIGQISLLMETAIGGNGRANYMDLGFHHYPKNMPGGSGMGLMDHGIHLIDLFRWLLNSKVTSVFGQGNISGKPPQTEFAILYFENGAIAQLIYNDISYSTNLEHEGIYSWGGSWGIDGKLSTEGGWESHPGYVNIYGDLGSLRIYHYANKLFLFNNNKGIPIQVGKDAMPGNFKLQLLNFLDSVRKNMSFAVPAMEGLEALKVIEAIYESKQQQKIIYI